MDFTKFVSLVSSGALFFSRADKLNDAWEGAYPEENLRQRRLRVEANLGAINYDYMESEAKFHRTVKSQTFLSCWHLNQGESAAMWELYASRGEGIAIQSTFERFCGSFPDNDSMFHVFIGKVSYLNYDRDGFLEGNTFAPFLHKRRSFEHERELRAVTQTIFPSSEPFDEADPYADGLRADVDLNHLIETIYVAPNSQEWFTSLVKHVAEKYLVTAPVKQSDLQRDPVY